MPSLPGKRSNPKADAALALGSRGNHRKLSEEMKRGSKQWKKVLEGMKRECAIALLCGVGMGVYRYCTLEALAVRVRASRHSVYGGDDRCGAR